MQLKKIKLVESLATICAFSYMFNPSLKFIQKSSWINAIPFFIFLLTVLVVYESRNLIIQRLASYFISIVAAFFAFQLISILFAEQAALVNTFRVISVFISFIAGVVIANHINYDKLRFLSFVWVILLCVASGIGYIEYADGKDFNHLNFTLPLSTIIAWCLYRVFNKNEDDGVCNIMVLAVLFYTVLFAGSRTAIIMPFVVSFSIAMLSWQLIDKKRTIGFIFAFFLVLMAGVEYILRNFSDYFLYKVQNMSTYTEDSRYLIYSQSIEKILDNPFGIGYGQYVTFLDGIYPHNLILEVALNSGMIPALLILFLFLFAIKHSMKRLVSNYDSCYSFSLIFFCYSLASWMLSYDFASSSVVFFTFGLVVSHLGYRETH